MFYIFLQTTCCSYSHSLGHVLISTLNNRLKMSPEAVQKIINTNCEFSPDALNLYLICLVSKMFYSKTSKGHFPMSLHILKSPGNGTQPGEFVLQSRNSLFIEWWVRHLSLLTVFRYRNPSSRPRECKLVTLLISSALQCHLSVPLSLSLFFFLNKSHLYILASRKWKEQKVPCLLISRPPFIMPNTAALF